MTLLRDAPPDDPALPVPVQWTPDRRAVRLLDQTLLPGQERYLRLETVQGLAEAISALRVRGAPAIGIAAAMGLAVVSRRRLEKVSEPESEDVSAFAQGMQRDADVLRSTRPTAVNLAWALDRVERAFLGSVEEGLEAGVQAMIQEADALAREDREMCRRIGETGADLIPSRGGSVLTHCNAGALATGGMGTALAPVYVAHARGVAVSLLADETRPLLQGARLTAWEAARAGVPVTLISDSMAGSIMASGMVDMVLVGADRVAANGDVANKIGTYPLAVLARFHGLPFYVALPRSTFDLEADTGLAIPIEERAGAELTNLGGEPTAPPGVRVKNPAFDLTPAHLVTAFITDGGILRPPYGPAIRELVGSGLPRIPTTDLKEEEMS